MSTHLILVGGFLGAGKTTLLQRAASLLTTRRLRVGLITNDQGHELVDTDLLGRREMPVEEVAGGCFCCRFGDLYAALDTLLERVEPDVILAEPVGSCTDLMATVMRPLSAYASAALTLAPLTILAEATPRQGQLSTAVGYLQRKQLAEAETLLLNKLDLLDPATHDQAVDGLGSRHPNAHIFGISARTGAGVETWLDHTLSTTSALANVLELDYVRYAQAEAQLGWLNARGAIKADVPFLPRNWLKYLLNAVREQLSAEGAAIAHLKAQIVVPESTFKAGITDADAPISWDDRGTDAAVNRAQFAINARVETTPNTLEKTVRQVLAWLMPASEFTYQFTHFESFSPRPPQPTYRMLGDGNSSDQV